mmetsp:Transcript_75995/g.180812  ORF Transcript_75995/g.180812 Transcript_75995/m.180812 type:complete len:201 (+) Transcript_75995:1839-2441(+)
MITRAGPCHKPIKSSNHVLLRGHSLRLVVSQLPDVRDVETKVIREQGDEGIRVVDAATKLDRQTYVVDAHCDSLALPCHAHSLDSTTAHGHHVHAIVLMHALHASSATAKTQWMVWQSTKWLAITFLLRRRWGIWILILLLVGSQLPVVIFSWSSLWVGKSFHGCLRRSVILILGRCGRKRNLGIVVWIHVSIVLRRWRR